MTTSERESFAADPKHQPPRGRRACSCSHPLPQDCGLIAITGGPGAGKTAILNIAQNLLCSHTAFVPEAATIIFSGGFWRAKSSNGLAATQNAIFHVQRQLEDYLIGEKDAIIGLCDRGTVDGCAYWPEDKGDFWAALGTTQERELSRYKAVIHLRTPPAEQGYDHSNPERMESAEKARTIDEAILKAWEKHPSRCVIDAEQSFELKIMHALKAIRAHLPPCCE